MNGNKMSIFNQNKIIYQALNESDAMAKFSILIPTWNNLPLLKLCVESIRKNSTFNHQIILHINENKDGTLDWAKKQRIDYTFSDENIGICLAMNAAASLVQTDYIVYMNDDMYALPEWDKYLWAEIRQLDHPYFFLSATTIEAKVTRSNQCNIVPYDFGKDAASFDEQKLLAEFAELPKEDWCGATWPPNLVPKKLWDLVGGYSVEFSPGMYSDPDFSMKLWQIGVRYFKGIAQSRVYHFLSHSTGRIVKNNGSKQFLQKWGITNSTFSRYYLRRGKLFNGPLPEPEASFKASLARLKSRLKRMW